SERPSTTRTSPTQRSRTSRAHSNPAKACRRTSPGGQSPADGGTKAQGQQIYAASGGTPPQAVAVDPPPGCTFSLTNA
ncbi:MAG: hypothetical protein V1778_04760, partial [bacterium]